MTKLPKLDCGLYCSANGKIVVELFQYEADLAKWCGFVPVLRGGKYINGTRTVSSRYKFTRQYPARVVACQVTKGTTRKLESVSAGLYCSEAGEVVRVLSASYYCFFARVFPVYRRFLVEMLRSEFLCSYPIRITECVVEQGG